MPDYVVYGVGIEVKKFGKKSDAKKYLQRKGDKNGIYGLF